MKDSAYKEAGVDIEEAANLVERIKPGIAKTKRSGVMSNIGGFGALFDLKETGYQDPVLVSATDGVGTKIKIAIDLDKRDTIGIDAVAMCVNDLVVQGAEPLFFLDYFATGKLVNDVAEQVIGGIAEGCAMAGCALIGGETAEMPGMYAPGDYDIAGFTVGAVERDQLITGETIKSGDVILGLAANGVHSNGFSLVRKIIADMPDFTFETRAEFAPELAIGELLLMPTRIYVKPVLSALKAFGADTIKGMAHITGGGLKENVPRILPEGVMARIDTASWTLPPLFGWLRDKGGLTADDMAETLNCGIGYVIVCERAQAEALKAHLEGQGETVYTIGTIEERKADAPAIILENTDQAWA
jgi:phosphoribosylformylglycinamidine cyclo-ligase